MKQGWEIKKLGEVCDIICGQNYKAVKDDNGQYPIYGTGGIMGYASQYRCPANSIIIGRKGNINNPLYVECDFWNVDTAFGVVPNRDILIPKYFYLFCRNYDFTKHDVAVTIPSLRRTDIIKIPIPIPPLPEQEKIVSELDCLSGIIEKKRQQLKELDALAQSIFYEMFGNPVENERGWEVKKLGEIVVSNMIGLIRSGKEQDLSYSHLYFKMNNIGNNGKVDWTKYTRVNVSQEELCKYSLRKGDFLFNTRNSYELVGKTCVYNIEQDDTCVFNNNIMRIEFNESVNVYYMIHLFQNEYIKGQLDKIKKGTTNVWAIYFKDLAQIKVLLPPLPLQQTFAQKVEAIEKQKELIKQSIIEAETLLASRMQYYFEEG